MSAPLGDQELLGRAVSVEVGQAGQPTRAWTDLRVTFSVTSTKDRKPNQAKVSVYGLSTDSSARCREKDAVLQLHAGYKVPERLFIGGIDRSWREQQGVDAITYIEASDGGRQFRTAVISKSFTGEVTMRRLLDELATALGIPLGFIDPAFAGMPISSGVTLFGSVRDQLDRLAAQLGQEWFILDGSLVFLLPGKPTSEEGLLLSSDTGLIGSPEPTTDKKKKGLINVVSLLQPGLRPGRRFELRSRQYSGQYRVETVEHTGDNWAQDWYSKVTAREVTT